MNENKQKSNESGMKGYARYSSVAFQMIASVGIMAAIGWWLDGYVRTEKPYFTAAFSLVGVIAGLYLVIKEVTKK